MNTNHSPIKDIRILKLFEAFKVNGWVNIGIIDISTDWWFYEIIEFKSIWRPINISLYLTFLTDPEVMKEKKIWSIGISKEIPNNRFDGFIKLLDTNHINRINLIDWVKEINKDALIVTN